MNIKNVAVVGPWGSVGSAIINKLLENKALNITALIRQTSKYEKPSPSSAITVIRTDFDSSQSLLDAFSGQDAVLCCISGGAIKFPAQKLMIDAAIEAGIKLFFASEYVSNIMSPQYQIFPTEFVGDKVQVRQYLEEKAAKDEISWTALNGGPFFDMWLSKGVAGFDIPARTATIYGTGNNLSCWTPLPVIATAVLNMLRDPGPILNRAIFISGVQSLTQNTILNAFEAEIGEKFNVQHVDVKLYKPHALVALEEGDLRSATRALTINSQFNEEDSAANFWPLVENELVGVKPIDVREAVKEFLLTHTAK